MSNATEKVSWSVVHRPSDMGIDLPPGTSAKGLDATDYHVVDMEEGIERESGWRRQQAAIGSAKRPS